MNLRKTSCTLAAIAVLAGAPVLPAKAAATDPLIEGAKLCTHHLPYYEKQNGIPAHLLSAIATTESGRYHDGLKISIPWPWTINAAGKGYFFSSKGEAIAAVRRLRAQGVQSIDVGCMQVNLQHHPDAFASLDEAFDPQHNIAYAAGFLRSLYAGSHSWKRAAADYHSKTPDKGSRYVGRVYDSWNRLVDKLRLAKLAVPASSISEMQQMRPAPGVHYASAKPKRIKIAPLPEQVGRAIPEHKTPQMKVVQLSSKQMTTRRENRILVVKPEIQTAAVPFSALPNTGVLRIGSHSSTESRKSGPNFIFSD